MNQLQQYFENTQEVTLESLRADLDKLFQHAASLESATATPFLNTRFTDYLNKAYHFISKKLNAIRPSQYTYIGFSKNDKLLDVYYSDLSNHQIPMVEGSVANWGKWTSALQESVTYVDKVITELLIPTRDLLATLINRPERLGNQLATGNIADVSIKDLPEALNSLTDPRSKATYQNVSEAFSRMGDISTTSDAIDALADRISHSSRVRKSIPEEIVALIGEIGDLTSVLKASLESDKPTAISPQMVASVSGRLLRCAESVEKSSVVIYRREQFANVVKDAIVELRKVKRA